MAAASVRPAVQSETAPPSFSARSTASQARADQSRETEARSAVPEYMMDTEENARSAAETGPPASSTVSAERTAFRP
jgi:hypothetical protein